MRLPLFLAVSATVALSAPLRVLDENPSGVVVEMRAALPSTSLVRRAGVSYTALSVDDFESEAAAGQPALPNVTAQLFVPSGKRVVLERLDAAPATPIPLPHDIAFAEREPVHDGKKHEARRSAAAYGQRYGMESVVIEDVSYAGTEKIATLRFWPVRYDAPRRKLAWRPRVTAYFRFVPELRAASPPVGGGNAGVARYVVLNTATAPAPTRTRAVDLLIAHESHREAVLRLVHFKRMSGRQVREYYVSGKTAAQLKDIIATEYKKAQPPTATLLVGNIDQLPAWPGSGDNSRTDFPYQNLDGGEVPDVSLGRIPAHDAAELGALIDKIISREIEPRNVGEILLTAGKDTSLGCPQNVTKVGAEFAAAGSDIVLRKKFKTEVGTQAVVDAYNDSPNLVVYDGHGNQQGMSEIPLNISDLPKLTNKSYYLILDIACLNAHWSSAAKPRNFAESILLRPELGAAGIMASGGSGFGHDFFRSLGTIAAAARKNLSTDTKMNEIGQVILAAKIKHTLQDRSYWNYYGDPASSVWETTMSR